MEESTPSLRIHEWLAVIIIVSLLIVLTLITHFSESKPVITNHPHYIVDQKIEVFVEGAVEEPLRLIVTKGTRVEEVLEKVKLLPEADLSKLKLQAKVRRGQHIRIPQKKKRVRKSST